MEVVALTGSNKCAPFKREVREWQHIDSKTGRLLSGRLEADRYVNGNTNSFGKSISQNIQTSDGIHSQHKQMNILQTITSNGGALQVIQAHSVQKTSSRRAITSTTYSSHYSNNNLSGSSPGQVTNGSDDLLSIPRSMPHHEVAPRLKALLTSPTAHLMAGTSSASIDNTSNRKNHLFHHANNKMNQNIVGTEQSRQQLNEMLYGNNKESFSLRGRSASIEDLTNADETSFDGDVEPYEWKRVSKIRRSLQFPKATETKRAHTRPPDLPENSVNVWKIKQDIESLENGSRLSAVMKNNHVNLVALDSVLKGDQKESLESKPESAQEDSKSNCITADSLKEIRRRLKKLNNGHDLFKDELCSIDEHMNQKSSNEQNCKSLELRKNRERDGSLDDWLNRRKSYGFEKMQQSTETFSGIESSTDSGLGRSSDLSSNWSPTVDSQRTIITFGDKSKPATTLISLFSNLKTSEASEKPIPIRRSLNKKEELKRHSIAVDESRYVDDHYCNSNDRKISFVNLNCENLERHSSNDGFLDDIRRHKKVEFCKTEIHFAADSGRVNIVETDGKPPPTSNFRRRRRTSGSVLDESDSDELLLNGGIRESESSWADIKSNNVTTTIGSVSSNLTSRDEDSDDGQSEDSSLRGILKNKPVKPKPYHLGENLDTGNSLWGVRLKPVENQHTTWRNSTDLEFVATKKLAEDALELEFKNLVKTTNEKPNIKQFESTVMNNGYATKINLSTLPQITADSSSTASHTHSHPLKAHKISIDLKLPHPSSIDTIMDELKSTSLIIETMKSQTYFDDAMRQLEQESPLIRTSSLRLNQDLLMKSSSTSNMMLREKSDGVKYSSSLDGDRGILEGKDDDFEFLNGFLEENRKFQMSIAKKKSPQHESVKPVAAPRLRRNMNSSDKLSQQLSQLKHLYDIANESDDNIQADEEVKSYLVKNGDEKLSELSGSWNRLKVKKIAKTFQSYSDPSDNTKYRTKAPVISLSDSSTSNPVEAQRTSFIQIGTSGGMINNNINNNVSTVQQENSVKVNIQNFESRSPALSRSNSLRIKKDDTNSAQRKLSTGTRQLRDHELTYFGLTQNKEVTEPKETKSSSFAHLSTSKSSLINTSIKSITNSNIRPTTIITEIDSTTIDKNKPDLIMHHQRKFESKSPELSEKKPLIENRETMNLEPLYENLYRNEKVKYERKTDLARDEKILNELTRAADEIMNTCKEMYHADSEEKRRKSLQGNTTSSLETITEGRQQRTLLDSQKIMKSKGIQVSRNFEDSLRRYHPTPQRTSSQSSIESLPRTVKVSSLSSTAIRTKRITTQSGESTTSTNVSSSTSKKRANGTIDGSKQRIYRVSSRERMQQSNASSSEDLPNSTEVPRRPRRTKTSNVKQKEEVCKEQKKSSRSITNGPTESSLRRAVVRTEPSSLSKVSSEMRHRPSVKLSTPKATLGSHTLSTTYVSTEHKSQTMMIPPRRKNQRRNVVRRHSSLKSKKATTKRIQRKAKRTQLESCICS